MGRHNEWIGIMKYFDNREPERPRQYEKCQALRARLCELFEQIVVMCGAFFRFSVFGGVEDKNLNITHTAAPVCLH
jgi:hypothetical protein